MMINPDERRDRIMAAVDEDRFEDVEAEVQSAVVDGLMDDLRNSTTPFAKRDLGRSPLPLGPRRDL